MTVPATAKTLSEDDFFRTLKRYTIWFSASMLGTLALGVFFIIPEPTVTGLGLLIGAVLGLVCWFVPGIVIRNRLTNAAGRGVSPEQVVGVVASAVWVGISLTASPALCGLPIALQMGHDVAPFAVSMPLAMASMIVNVTSPAVVRGHLARLRGSALS